uniref:Uncharacterized protein n=2 Tax=Meloidogyne TaxID=189290 RepID=A0A6V7X6H2_MELEN|nr:unnamed protein product [Meloidogyne enterolobii]
MEASNINGDEVVSIFDKKCTMSVKEAPTSGPHSITICKSESGFGFNVKGQVSEGGQLRFYCGQLYAPLQHVSAVLHGGAAYKAGLRQGDRIVEVNGVNVEGANHRQVVELIKAGGDRLDLLVITAPLDNSDSSSNCCGYNGASAVYDDHNSVNNDVYRYYDYSEKRSLPITIPNYQTVNTEDEQFVAYSIHMAGRHLGSRRFSEFLQLNKLLKEEFSDFSFPKLPNRWPFRMSEQQLDGRRRLLEQYLEKICAVKVIADCEIVQEFLMEDSSSSSPVLNVSLRLLVCGETLTLNIKRHSDTHQVYQQVLEHLKLSPRAAANCALFEMIDDTHFRRLHERECPHNIYIQNYSSAASSCIVLRKWCFDVSTEEKLCELDSRFKAICFHQAVEDINSGSIRAGEKLYQLKALQREDRCDQYLNLARQLEGYSSISFPQCQFEVPEAEEGLATLTVDMKIVSLKVQKDHIQKGRTISLKWSNIIGYSVFPESHVFQLKYFRGDSEKELNLISVFCESIFDVFNRVSAELKASSSSINTNVD